MQKFEELIDSVFFAKRKFYADWQYKESNYLSHYNLYDYAEK